MHSFVSTFSCTIWSQLHYHAGLPAYAHAFDVRVDPEAHCASFYSHTHTHIHTHTHTHATFTTNMRIKLHTRRAGWHFNTYMHAYIHIDRYIHARTILHIHAYRYIKHTHTLYTIHTGLLLCYTMATTPFLVGFYWTEPPCNTSPTLTFDVFVDVFFIVEIGLTFFTGVYYEVCVCVCVCI